MKGIKKLANGYRVKKAKDFDLKVLRNSPGKHFDGRY